MNIEYKKLKELSRSEMTLMNKARVLNFGKEETKDWKKEYPLNSKVFFLKNYSIVVSFLLLIPITITIKNKKYNIFGICSVISLKKKKGYGLILVNSVLSYIKKTKKSALGFTTETDFFEKTDFNIKKGLIKKFIYVDPITNKKISDNVGDGVYYNGKDNFIKGVLSVKSKIEIPILHW